MSVDTVDNMFDSLLFVQPGRFRVEYDINAYMHPGVDAENARRQWQGVVESVREHAPVTLADYSTLSVPDVRPVGGLPDTVFCANHAVPVPGTDSVICSRMAHDERVDEVAHFRAWAGDQGYDCITLDGGVAFEGAGDAKWHPGGDLLWVGHGPRTDRAAIDQLDALLDARVVPLELVSELYYHLDVCFTPLDPETVLVVPEAFTADGVSRIEREFETVLRVPDADTDTMGGNCSRIGPGTVAIDEANTETIELLERHGHSTVPVDTSEFRKSGGSVDCLFLRLP